MCGPTWWLGLPHGMNSLLFLNHALGLSRPEGIIIECIFLKTIVVRSMILGRVIIMLFRDPLETNEREVHIVPSPCSEVLVLCRGGLLGDGGPPTHFHGDHTFEGASMTLEVN